MQAGAAILSAQSDDVGFFCHVLSDDGEEDMEDSGGNDRFCWFVRLLSNAKSAA